MTSLYDGLGGEELTISGLTAGGVSVNPYFAGSITSASQIKGSQMVVTGSFVDTDTGVLRSVRVGAGYGGVVQCGSNVTGAGSNVWVSYPVAYTSAPQCVIVSPRSAAIDLYVSGTPTTGSFIVIGASPPQTFNWLAVGFIST
jgi:hypothetical protein